MASPRLQRLFRILLIACLGCILAILIMAYRIQEFPKHIGGIKACEYGIVLGARTEGTEATPVFGRRIEYGIILYKEGKIRKLVFTGAPGNPQQAIVAKNVAMAAGVPESDILIEIKSNTTWENLYYSQEVIPDWKSTQVLIVSDPLHLKRALRMADDQGYRAMPAAVPNTLVQSGWARTKFTLRETFAYYYYLIKRLV